MTARRPRWQYVLIGMLALLIWGALLTPYMTQTESELRIHVNQQGLTLPDGFFVYQRLYEYGIHVKSITPAEDGLVIRLDSPEQQLLARKALQTILASGYTIALGESSSPIPWMHNVGRSSMNLG